MKTDSNSKRSPRRSRFARCSAGWLQPIRTDPTFQFPSQTASAQSPGETAPAERGTTRPRTAPAPKALPCSPWSAKARSEGDKGKHRETMPQVQSFYPAETGAGSEGMTRSERPRTLYEAFLQTPCERSSPAQGVDRCICPTHLWSLSFHSLQPKNLLYLKRIHK